MTDPSLNEAGVREEIIAPILRALHYASGGDNDIRYELPLRYPKDFIGRKQPGTDPPIRGRADYVCYAGGRVSWTIEAKASGAEISADDIEQAYSYAKHAQIRAVYFCLCNGLSFQVFITEAAPEQGPILTVDPRNRRAAVRALRPFLGPPALLHRFAHAASTAFPPVGPGLLSYAQIIRGSISYEHFTPDVPHMRGFTVAVTGGAIQLIDGGLCAYWESQAPYTSIQRLVDRLGLTRVEARSTATMLSENQDMPTVFENELSTVFPEGEVMPNLLTHEDVTLLRPLFCQLTMRASATLFGTVLTGPFDLHIRYETTDGTARQPLGELCGTGEFEFLLR